MSGYAFLWLANLYCLKRKYIFFKQQQKPTKKTNNISLSGCMHLSGATEAALDPVHVKERGNVASLGDDFTLMLCAGQWARRRMGQA